MRGPPWLKQGRRGACRGPLTVSLGHVSVFHSEYLARQDPGLFWDFLESVPGGVPEDASFVAALDVAVGAAEPLISAASLKVLLRLC